MKAIMRLLLYSPFKYLKPYLQSNLIRPVVFFVRQDQPVVIKKLYSVLQHWAVSFGKYVFPDFNYIIRIYTNDVLVKGSMMYFTQGKSILDYWFTRILFIRNN